MDKNTDKNGNEVSREQVMFFILSLGAKDVLSVYTGKAGCMCGCNGNHRYNPDHRAEASKDRGYEVSEDECSSRSVSLVLNKFKKDMFAVAGLDEGHIIHFRDEDRNRQYAVYLRPSSALAV